MKRRLPWLAAVSVAAFLPASPASAGKNDDAWAKCIWEQVPASASNWLKMPSPRQGGLRKCAFIQADGTFIDA